MAKKIKIIDKCQDTYEGIEFYVNGNQTHFITYNKNLHMVEKIQSNDWKSAEIICLIKVIDKDNDAEYETKENFSIQELISEDVSFIRTVMPISSTIKPIAYFDERSGISKIKKHLFNEFFRAKEFLGAKERNKYSPNSNIIQLLKKETPIFYILIKNLFFKESDQIILNFINWLSACAYNDEHQSEFFCFIGTNEIDQGQGAGKGVLKSFLSDLLSNLVTQVSNDSFKSDFNSNLENKKIVIFDEVSFKSLNYAKLKDITGCDVLAVQPKGVDTYETRNVSSWLLFSNEHDLKNKITLVDRRAFIIRPNPKNNSLKAIINRKFSNNSDFNTTLTGEIPNLIHILGLCVNNKVLDPVVLLTNAKRDYFKEKSAIGIDQLEDFTKVLINKKLNQKICQILKEYQQEGYELIHMLLKNDCLNKNGFKILFNTLINLGFIKKSEFNKEWEKLKEISRNHGYILKEINYKSTSKYKQFVDRNLLIKKNFNKAKLKQIKAEIREYFGSYINPYSNKLNPTEVAIAPMVLDGITQQSTSNNPQVNN